MRGTDMCQIYKIFYKNGQINIDVTSTTDLTNNGMLELYLFEFHNGDYGEKHFIKQTITSNNLTSNGTYHFNCGIPERCKVKCVISQNNKVLEMKERFIGNKYRITMSEDSSPIGKLYTVKSMDVTVSRKLICYGLPNSEVKLSLPADLIAGEPMTFTIKENGFRPKLEGRTNVAECFIFEG